VRSLFVRKLFDLPQSTSHELAVILFDVWPVEVALLKRRQKFLKSVLVHDFTFVRDACELDLTSLLTSPLGWHNNLVRLMRRIDPDLSTVDLNPIADLDQCLSNFSDRSLFNYFFIQDGTSDSLSFFRLFASLEVLNSFRGLLCELGPEHSRLVILFSSSLLRFRFCAVIRDACPLCKKPWLWNHFIGCPKLCDIGVDSGRTAIANFEALVRVGDWSEVLKSIRHFLLSWADAVPDVIFPRDVIDSLAV
jgi:hypothetical protein